MDADIPEAGDLSLPQAFLLLATNDGDGEPRVPRPVLQAGVAGAILAELDLLGAIELRDKHVWSTGTVVESDYQQQLEQIRHKSRPHTAKRWVSILESREEVRRIYEGMAVRGIVDHVGEKHLGIFRTTRYPEKDHAPEAALLQKVEAELAGGTADTRASALTALLYATGLLAELFPDTDHTRARELAASHWPSHAVAEEIRSIRLAEAEAAT